MYALAVNERGFAVRWKLLIRYVSVRTAAPRSKSRVRDRHHTRLPVCLMLQSSSRVGERSDWERPIHHNDAMEIPSRCRTVRRSMADAAADASAVRLGADTCLASWSIMACSCPRADEMQGEKTKTLILPPLSLSSPAAALASHQPFCQRTAGASSSSFSLRSLAIRRRLSCYPQA